MSLGQVATPPFLTGKSFDYPPHFVDTEATREYYARYLAEIGLLDQQVGDAMKILKDKDLLKNTLIFFISEQGPQFAGAKWTNWSAGVKSAMLASWKGVIRPGTKLLQSCNMRIFFPPSLKSQVAMYLML